MIRTLLTAAAGAVVGAAALAVGVWAWLAREAARRF